MKRLVLGLAAVLFMVSTLGAQSDSTFKLYHDPGANTLATATKAAVAGQRNVADCVVATLTAAATAPAAINVQVLIRDGATGVGTILASWRLALPATGGGSSMPVDACPGGGGLQIIGTAGNAMTVEFSAAAGANTFETIWARGHTER
jgi:hypothetical protein